MQAEAQPIAWSTAAKPVASWLHEALAGKHLEKMQRAARIPKKCECQDELVKLSKSVVGKITAIRLEVSQFKHKRMENRELSVAQRKVLQGCLKTLCSRFRSWNQGAKSKRQSLAQLSGQTVA